MGARRTPSVMILCDTLSQAVKVLGDCIDFMHKTILITIKTIKHDTQQKHSPHSLNENAAELIEPRSSNYCNL